MNFTLRDYQQKFADKIVQVLAKQKKLIACAATGSGKTKTFIYLANRAQSKGFTVLVITEATKIYEQLTDELSAGNINSSVKDQYIEPGRTYIAMAQTLSRRPKMIAQLHTLSDRLLIINDEAHIGTQTKLLKQLPSALLIGFTATPDFRFAKHLPELYNAIVVGPQPDELVQSGYLSSYRHFARVLADLDQLKITNGEFTEESQELIFESKKVYDGLIKDLSTSDYKKAMIYTASIKHCNDVHDQLTAAGINSIKIHSKVSDADQSYGMAQYRQGLVNVCVSVGILTKGFDMPTIDLIILNRATTSLPLYLQMIGRGSRISNGKPHFNVFDYGGNFTRHGLWDAEIDWSKKWNQKPKKKKDGVAPIKMCPQCDYINPISVAACRNCGFVFEKIENKIDEEKTKLIEVTASYRKLIGKLISQLSPYELAIYAKFKNKKPYAARIAKAHGQTDIKYLNDYAYAMGYKPSWVNFQSEQLNGPKIEYHDIILR